MTMKSFTISWFLEGSRKNTREKIEKKVKKKKEKMEKKILVCLITHTYYF